MAIVLRKKTVFLMILLVLGLVFLFLGFAGDSWFKTEPVNSIVSTENGKITNSNSELEENVKAIIPEEEAKIVEKMEGLKFFAEYRLERDRTRSQQIEILKEITQNSKTDEETRSEAQKKLMNMTNNLEKEVELENLLRAKNFKDAVVFIQENSVTVIILTNDLTEKDTELISQLVTRSTGVSREGIVIIPKN